MKTNSRMLDSLMNMHIEKNTELEKVYIDSGKKFLKCIIGIIRKKLQASNTKLGNNVCMQSMVNEIKLWYDMNNNTTLCISIVKYNFKGIVFTRLKNCYNKINSDIKHYIPLSKMERMSSNDIADYILDVIKREE